MESRKIVLTNLQSSNGDTDVENRLMDKSWGEEGEDEMDGESSMEAYTLAYGNR